MGASIGLKTLGSVGTDIQAAILSGEKFNTQNLRTNKSLLLKDEWIRLDRTIVQVARTRLRAVNDLVSRGYRESIDGMSNTMLQWQTQSRTEGANVDMDPRAIGNFERVAFDLESLPLPIVHAEYNIGLRDLRVSRKLGTPLSVRMAQQKSQDVAEKVEDILVNGLDGYTYGGGTIRGYTDHPSRATSVITDWASDSTTGADILEQVLAMKQDLIDKKKYGPYMLYIPTAYETKMDEDFKSETQGTIRERLAQIQAIGDNIAVLDALPDNNVLLVQLSDMNVQIVDGMPLTNVNWNTGGGMDLFFKIMTIMVPRFFVDQDGNLGVAHATLRT